jgi:hypothetical protein
MYLIPLNQLLQNDREAINQLNNGLTTRGYVFVQLSEGFSLRPHVENGKQSSVAAKFEGETGIPMSKSGLSPSYLRRIHKYQSYTKTADQVNHIPISPLTVFRCSQL